MFSNPSLTTRIFIGKLVGLTIGLLIFASMPYLLGDVDLLLRWGVLLWYTTMGAIIGVFGVYTRHPVLNVPVHWWWRAPLLGAWMNFVLVFFVYDRFNAMLVSMFGAQSGLTSPWLFVVEGAIVGLVIGYFATRFGGEGKATVEN